jgi:hypothetical protein
MVFSFLSATAGSLVSAIVDSCDYQLQLREFLRNSLVEVTTIVVDYQLVQSWQH